MKLRSLWNTLSAVVKVTTLLGVSSLFFFWAFRAVEYAGLIKAHQDVCNRLRTDYVKKNDPKVKEFVRNCLNESSDDVRRALSDRLNFDPRRALIEIINQRLSALRVSHLNAFAPDETVQLWTGEAVDTGARGRLVDGEIIVTRTLPQSPAEQAGVHAGDLVIAVDGIPVQDPEDLRHQSGFWEILRPDETRVNLPVKAEVIQEKLEPYWLEKQERSGIRILKIPSFLAQAIESDQWRRVSDEISEMQVRGDRLIIDVRGNAGGSFPAMLRVLGAVSCRKDFIGWIYRDNPPDEKWQNSEIAKHQMKNNIAAEPQLEQLESDGAISLIPFQEKKCFDGPLIVLIDQGTGSVSEIFAQAIKERPRSFVMGWRSAGHVVMARWFQIRGLSSDYTVSIPVALYRSAKGQELEGVGVSPDQLLTDDLKRWRSKRDPWIEEATRALRVVSK